MGDGRLEFTKDHELKAMKDAIAGLGIEGYNPPITFVVVSKRINTKFFLKTVSDDQERCVPEYD